MNDKLLALVLTAALVLPCATAQAVPVRADFSANFYPPNPCNATELGDLTHWALRGTFQLFYKIDRAGELIRASPGAPGVSAIGCGESATTGFSFDLGLERGATATLFLSFEGALGLPNPGPPDMQAMPVYAFTMPSPGPPEAPDPGPPEKPEATPLIELGEISFAAPNPGPPEMSLFAFASPGHVIGSITANVRVVPEPASLLLLGIGLLSLISVRRMVRDP